MKRSDIPHTPPGSTGPKKGSQGADGWERWEKRLRSRRRRLFVAVVVAAAAVRAVYFVQLNAGPLIHQHLWDQTDMNYFDRWARAIVSGDVLSRRIGPPLHAWQLRIADAYYRKHPDAAPAGAAAAHSDEARRLRAGHLWERWCGPNRCFQEPLYPYLVAATYRLSGPDVRHVFVWQMMLGVATSALLYLLAARAFGETCGLVAGLTAALFGPLLYLELILLRDSMVAFAGIALAMLAGRALDRPSARAWLVFGAASGIAVMLKSHFLLLFGAAAAIGGWRERRRGATLARDGVALVAGLAMGVSLLVLRNLAAGASPLATAGNAAATIIVTNAHGAGPAHWSEAHFVDVYDKAEGRLLPTLVEALRTHPSAGSYLALLGAKFAFAWHWFEWPGNENYYYYRLQAPVLRWLPTMALVAPLAIVGLALSLRRAASCAPLYLPLVANLPVLVFFFVQSRYRAALGIALVPFAACAFVAIARWIIEGRPARAAAVTAAAVVLGVWTWRPLPPRTPVIRLADRLAPYTYYYLPRINAAQARGDFRAAANILAEVLQTEPEEIRASPGAAGRIAEGERATWQFFARLHEIRGQLLRAAGDEKGARREAARAAELSAVANPR